jgi:spermidine synthase
VGSRFEEICWQQTPMGPLSLRRRVEPSLNVDVYEVKLGDEFLMSSLFTVAEVQLARLGLVEAEGDHLDVLVGGLGLGYTALAVLDDPRVRSLTVVEALPEVIGWHHRQLLPETATLTADARARLVHGDFFERVRNGRGFTAAAPERYHAILVDIDHTPRHVLHPSHAGFYTADGLQPLTDRLHPAGVFGLWSDDPPDDEFLAELTHVFPSTSAHVVSFPNPLTGGQSANTVYVSQR